MNARIANRPAAWRALALAIGALGLACSGVQLVEPLPSSIKAEGCSLEVMPLPPSAPFETLGQARTLSFASLAEFARKGCAMGADAVVVPVPPGALGGAVWGTFIRRCPPSGCAGGPVPAAR